MIIPQTRLPDGRTSFLRHRLGSFVRPQDVNANSLFARGIVNPFTVGTQDVSPASASFTALSAFGMDSGDGLVIKLLLPLVSILATLVYVYRGAIRQRLEQMEEESIIFSMGLEMERITNKDTMPHDTLLDTTVFQNLKLLELDPDVKARFEAQGFSLLSLGDYMASLKPKALPKNVSIDDMPKVIQSEIEAALSAALLKALGPNLGRVFLPVTGLANTQTKSVATNLAVRAMAKSETDEDRGNIPVNLMSLLALSGMNAQVKEAAEQVESTTNKDRLTAMQKMKLGEVGNEPSFAANNLDEQPFVPNPFDMSSDFTKAIFAMEDMLREQKTLEGQVTEAEEGPRMDLLEELGKTEASVATVREYDPDDRSMAESIPLNPRVFPGLHLGWGHAKCTNTNREVLQNRLLSVILNRLGANYYRRANGEEDELFVVNMSGEDITSPGGLMQTLIDTGHEMEAVPTAHVTTFGIAMSVKEKDGSWSNIPLACFLDSGYEDKDGKKAPAVMPHSGLSVEITGPLLGSRRDGTPNRVNIQHFVAIDGFCGWYTRHNADVPWHTEIPCGRQAVTGKDLVRATRIAGLYAVTLNGLATEKDLPLGGYGLTAVCNDSAAVMEQCLYGTTSIYPMTSIGSYMMRTVRYASRLRDTFETRDGMEQEVADLTAILKAMRRLPSDLNSSPNNASNAAKRVIYTLPKEPHFKMMGESKRIMESILEEEAMEEVAAARV